MIKAPILVFEDLWNHLQRVRCVDTSPATRLVTERATGHGTRFTASGS